MAAVGLAFALRPLTGGRNMVRLPHSPDSQAAQGCVPGPACGNREDNE